MEAVILIDWCLIVSDTELHSLNKDWAAGLYSLLINDGRTLLISSYWYSVMGRWLTVLAFIVTLIWVCIKDCKSLFSWWIETKEWDGWKGRNARSHICTGRNTQWVCVFQVFIFSLRQVQLFSLEHRCRFQLWPSRLKTQFDIVDTQPAYKQEREALESSKWCEKVKFVKLWKLNW